MTKYHRDVTIQLEDEQSIKATELVRRREIRNAVAQLIVGSTLGLLVFFIIVVAALLI
jgi:hypothetical protein